MQPPARIRPTLWCLAAGALLYVLFMLVFTVVFDGRRPVCLEEYLPLAALIPIAAYLLAAQPR